jgi:hypothetical protein
MLMKRIPGLRSSIYHGFQFSCWFFFYHHTISSFISVNISPYYPHAILSLLKSISSPPFCPKKSFDHPISHSPHSSQSHLIPISRSWSELLECPCLSSVSDSQYYKTKSMDICEHMVWLLNFPMVNGHFNFP